MAVACILAVEALVHQDETRSSRHRLEADRHLGLGAVLATRLFPRPGERQSSRGFDDMKDAAHGSLPAAGPPQDNPPSPAGSDVEIMNHRLIPIGGPPSHNLLRFDPQGEETLARPGNKPFEAKHLF